MHNPPVPSFASTARISAAKATSSSSRRREAGLTRRRLWWTARWSAGPVAMRATVRAASRGYERRRRHDLLHDATPALATVRGRDSELAALGSTWTGSGPAWAPWCFSKGPPRMGTGRAPAGQGALRTHRAFVPAARDRDRRSRRGACQTRSTRASAARALGRGRPRGSTDPAALVCERPPTRVVPQRP